jgi:endo-1,4-beta-xylanase
MKNNQVFTGGIESMQKPSGCFISQQIKPKGYVVFKIGFLLMIVQFVLMSALNAQIALNKCKFLGNIISSSVPSNFTTYWDQVTPENAGKWGSVQSIDQATFNWTGLDLAYNTAKSNNFLFKQHNFVWGSQQPSWLGSLTDNSAIASAVENWISAYGQRYPNTDLIDVVNEPIHTQPSYSAALGGSGTSGWDWVVWAFQKARTYCPNAKLLINEYGILNSDANTDTYISIINILKSQNLIDGIGCQGHGLETTPIATITNNLNKLAALGIPIYISEYDVDISDDNQQLAVYQQQIPVFWANPMVKGITLWGYIQGSIWKTNAYLVDAYGNERPAMTWLKQYIPSASCTITATTDIKAGSSEGAIFPNPTSDGKFSIELPSDAESVNVVDLGGRIVKTVKLSGEPKIDMTIDNAGVYIVQIAGSRTVINKKLIVK